MYFPVLTFCFMLLWFIELSAAQICTSNHLSSSALRVSITSKRNHTGHWIAQIQLEHGAGENETGPWKVDIDHSIAKCGENDTVVIMTTATAPLLIPGPDYKFIPGLGYYKFHNTLKPWQEAQRICTREGAHLAIINTEDEEKALVNTWSSSPKLASEWLNKVAYIGIHDKFQDGEFRTVFNEPLSSTLAKWGNNEPNGGTGENCGALDCSISRLIDVGCNATLRFFCEREL